MYIKYYHEFLGADNILNRFEIHSIKTAVQKEVEATTAPITLEYQAVKKLDPIRSSQATIGLISKSNFQFSALHTDNMQDYMVKFYRAGKLYWIGWLDAELYNEQLSAVPPYPVEFSAADFNIWERLKYRNASDNKYTDIAPMVTHLKRCFDSLGLSFDKLYIGCSTVPNGAAMSAGETPLHVLHMMSQNYYDEDGEPMTCREVVESILQPFGLMMVQKNACVYIYDYNTVRGGLAMKRYNFSTFAYEAAETVKFDLGNLVEIGFLSTDGEYGFEEMVNNVTITSSLYAEKSIVTGEVTEKNLSESVNVTETEVLKKELFAKCEEVEKVGDENFVIYTNKDSESTIIGMSSPYNPFSSDHFRKTLFRVKSSMPIISTDSKKNSILLKMSCYVNCSDNPFDVGKTENDAELCKIEGNLYTIDGDGTPLYYHINDLGTPRWESCATKFRKGAIALVFCNQTVKGSNIYNSQLTNSNVTDTSKAFDSVKQKDSGKGLVIPIGTNIYGTIVFEILGAIVLKRLPMDHSEDLFFPNGGNNVKNIIYNDIDISVVDENNDGISTDDYEFKSYVNKKVSADFDEITLKCISANEDKMPVGRANILKKVADHYELQLSYTRAGQTDILERLLMCTIHSNFTTKNEKMSVDVKMTDNPALSYVSCNPILSGKYLVSGCTLDFHSGKTTITAVGYSDDVAKLSSIPYD